MRSFLLISAGAVLGSWLRFYLLKNLQFTHYRTIFVNLIACFGLGYVVSAKSQLYFSESITSLVLFSSVGFLASLSTFSTFVFEVFENLLYKRWMEAMKIVLISLIGGLLLASLGYSLGNV